MRLSSLFLLALMALACAGGPDAPASAPAVAPELPNYTPPPTTPASDPVDVAESVSGACSVGAAVADPDPAGLNVRDKPKGTVVGQVMQGTEVHLVQSDGTWVRYESPWNAEDEDKEWPVGWVSAKLLTTWLKTPAEYGPDAVPKLRAAPRPDAAAEVIRLAPMPTIALTGCMGDYVRAKLSWPDGVEEEGWLGTDDHCPSTVTNCS